jgi:hypothetical protein
MTRDSHIGQGERHRLDVALDRASVETDDLDAARWVLLGRLSRRSDDFAATAALQALNVYVSGQRFDAPSDAPARLQRAGLSGLQRLRRSKARITSEHRDCPQRSLVDAQRNPIQSAQELFAAAQAHVLVAIEQRFEELLVLLRPAARFQAAS